MPATSHAVRFVRSLALGAGLGAVSCAAAVTPSDGAAPVADATPAPDAPVACPPSQPTVGTPCPMAGLNCEYPPTCDGWRDCTLHPGSSTPVWSYGCVTGPMDPPELA